MSLKINCIPCSYVSEIKVNPIERVALGFHEQQSGYKAENDAFLDNLFFQTTFCDASMIVKTLEEFGMQNIIQKHVISATLDEFVFEFYKKDNEKNYFISAKFYNKIELNEVLDDLGALYLIKTQENVYKKLIELLEKYKVKYKEKIQDDDTAIISFNSNEGQTSLEFSFMTNATVSIEVDSVKNKTCLKYVELLKNALNIKSFKE